MKCILKYSMAALCLSSALGSSAAFAQALPNSAQEAIGSTANPARIQQEIDDRSYIPTVSPSVEVKDIIRQNAPEGADKIIFDLSSIAIEGVGVYTADDLRSVYANRLGTEVSLADIYVIANDLTNKYRDDGYILSQVIIPPQTIEGGRVKMRVVEGYINNINVEGDDQSSALALINKYAGKIRSNRAVNIEDLERYLLLINDLPGVEARSVLSPSPTQAGAADLRIIVERDPYDAFIGFDTFGSRYLGPIQLSGAFSINSFFGNNETITAQIVAAPDPKDSIELAYMSVVYSQPVLDEGTVAELMFTHTATEPGHDLSQFDVQGRSQFMRAKLTHPFVRSRSLNVYGHASFDWRDSETKNNLEVNAREDRIRSVRIGGRVESMDTILGVGINSLDIEVSQGLKIFGASHEDDVNLSRAAADPSYTKITAELQRLQRITSDLNLLIAAKGQRSSDALLSSEEFGVGGINYGRGYDASEIVGDEGFAGKLELQWNRPYHWNFVQDYQLFGFFDGGRTFNKDATTSSQKTDTLASTGLGIRADFLDNTKAGLMVAVPLNRDVDTQGDEDPRVYFNLNRSF